MLPYGSKRTLGDCLTARHKTGGKIHVIEAVKSHKYNRSKAKHLTNREKYDIITTSKSRVLI